MTTAVGSAALDLKHPGSSFPGFTSESGQRLLAGSSSRLLQLHLISKLQHSQNSAPHLLLCSGDYFLSFNYNYMSMMPTSVLPALPSLPPAPGTLEDQQTSSLIHLPTPLQIQSTPAFRNPHHPGSQEGGLSPGHVTLSVSPLCCRGNCSLHLQNLSLAPSTLTIPAPTPALPECLHLPPSGLLESFPVQKDATLETLLLEILQVLACHLLQER